MIDSNQLAAFGPVLVCPACDGAMTVNLDAFLDVVIAGQRVPCAVCPAQLDAWDALVRGISRANDLLHAVTFVGGGQVLFSIDAPTNKPLMLDLRKYGVPDGARVLRFGQTPQGETGAGLPVFVEANQMLGAHALPAELVLHPLHLGGEVTPVCRLAVTVAWAPVVADDVSRDLLINAFVAYGDKDYKRALLDADTALDIALRETVMPCLWASGLPKRERLGPVQRLAVLSAVARTLAMPRMREEVTSAVATLHEARNSARVAHGGDPVEPAPVAASLAGALVATRYLRAHGRELQDAFDIA